MRHPSRRSWFVVMGAAALLPLAGGAALAVHLFTDSAPDGVRLDAAARPPDSPAAATFDGTWVVDTESGTFEDFTSSYAGYRIRERLAGIGANTAVGRTPNVSGSLRIEGRTITDLSVTVDMTTLTSDDSRRDGTLRDRGLETAIYPTASFTLTEPIEVRGRHSADETIEVPAVGDVTLHGTTRRVTVPIQAHLKEDRIEAVTTFDVVLADYGIERPTGFMVLSIAEQGTVELHLLFEKESGTDR